MTMKGKGILGMWIDLLPETVDECDNWHIREHIPERIDVPGFNRARRYIALEGTPRYHAMYETDAIETLATPAYTNITAKPTDWAMRMRKDYRNAHRGVFRVTGSVGRGFGGCIASIRFAPQDGKAEGLRSWLLGETLPALIEERCVLGAHLWESDPALRAELTAKRAAGRDDKVVDWVLTVEATQRREIEDALKAKLPGDTLVQRGAKPGYDTGIYQFLFGMTE